MDDPRSDELLDGCGLVGHRLRLHYAWTDGLEGPAAKMCSRGGSAKWTRGKPLSRNPEAAKAEFKTRARRRNPAVVLSLSNLVGIEADGDLDELRAQHRIPELPETVTVRSRRGVHRYYRPPAGRSPVKVQLDPEGVIVSEDGYLVGAGAIHPSGVIYKYENSASIAELPAGIYDLLVELGGKTRSETRQRCTAGEAIPEGHRDVAIFWEAVELLRAETPVAEALSRLVEINTAQCRPPLDPKLVEKQLKGAVRFVRRHPSETEQARAEARRILRDRHSEQDRPRESTRAPRPSRKAQSLFLPFSEVILSGPVRWVWRGKIPENAVTLLAGRPKLGKSLLSVWLAAQLSRGLLEGSHYGQPAKTLLIAAEDPVDPIVKGRLIAANADESFVGTLASRPSRPPSSSGRLDHGLDRQGRQEAGQHPQANLGGLGGLDGTGSLARRITIPDEYELLEEIVVENEIALAVLDPINSFLSSKIDAHRDVEIRRVLDPLAALCARRRLAALAVVHLNRRTDTDVLNRITGSGGYGGSARSILTFGRHPEEERQRVVASEGNWQREKRSELFELREVIVFPDAAPEEQTQPALVHAGSSDLDSADLVDQLDDDRGMLDQAKEYLLGELALGPVAVADLRRGADAHGISWRTVERAKKLLGVEARRISSPSSPRGSGRWEWILQLEEQPE
jgi:hypothetical protein